MLNQDKFGNEIYSSTFKIMLENGNLLLKEGYKESRRKPNLFYKTIPGGLFFMDMRGTEEVPIWEDTNSLFYWKFYDIPNWKARRFLKEELKRLIKSKCPFRFSFEAGNDPIFENVNFLSFSPEYLVIDDGYCKFCGKDFQDDGEFCSKECEDKSLLALGELCEVCGNKIKFGEEVYHHIGYFPEKKIVVHKSCHNVIHKTDKYPELKPNKEEILKFYQKFSEKKKKKYCVICKALLEGRQLKFCLKCKKEEEMEKQRNKLMKERSWWDKKDEKYVSPMLKAFENLRK